MYSAGRAPCRQWVGGLELLLGAGRKCNEKKQYRTFDESETHARPLSDAAVSTRRPTYRQMHDNRNTSGSKCANDFEQPNIEFSCSPESVQNALVHWN